LGFAEILTITFVVLKLMEVIAWSWWLVLLPEIIAGTFYLIFIIFWIVVNVKLDKDIKKMRKDHDEWRKTNNFK